MEFLNSLLTVEDEERSQSEIIGWWEKRRILYNLIVLVCGLVSLGFMQILVYLREGRGLSVHIGIVGFALVCNVCYTLGWITEIGAPRAKTYGPKMFKAGLYFTLFFVFLPAFLHVVFSILNLLEGI
ncbi:hypothetical protein [Rufibacter roseus]|uniref:Uncharacterized protein n=1 Tax=Rufibacter roseus TaxID=1567108 RepID=A0ABW2DHP1_9BACT|nr:hypothetical protein [Rufibacter roseus]